MGVADRRLLDPGHRFLVTPLAEPGHWGLEMDLLATGGAISWLAGLFGTGIDEAALVALAAGVDPRDAPLVLPYLSPGEQGALWDPLLRGAFLGLELRHGRRHLARGLVNGIVLESRRCLTVLDETRQFGRELQVAGRSAANPAFCADLADATRRRVGLPGGPGAASSARGAALLAALAIDGVPSASAIVPAGTGPESASPAAEPDPGRAAMWDELWASYEQARHAVSQHYHLDPGAPRRPSRAGQA
jgi:xylulokinase